MFTNIYQTSIFFRVMAVAIAIFVLTATSLPLGYGFTPSAYAAGHDGEEPPEEPLSGLEKLHITPGTWAYVPTTRLHSEAFLADLFNAALW